MCVGGGGKGPKCIVHIHALRFQAIDVFTNQGAPQNLGIHSFHQGSVTQA